MSKQDFASTPRTANISYGPTTAAPAPESFLPGASILPREVRLIQPKPVAVLVCHGMGQQVRYETIGQVAASILNEATRRNGTIQTSGVQLSCQNDEFLTHAELHWTTSAGTRHDVHVYEAYWAPLTEGKVTYVETLTFLINAGVLGLWRSITSTFQRWMFGSIQSLPIGALTGLSLFLMLVVILAEAALVGTALALVAAELKKLAAAPWPATISFSSVYTSVGHIVLDLLRFLFPRVRGLYACPCTTSWWKALAATLGWLLFLAHGFFIRYFIIQYAGDVAAYISPYKDSKFEALRHEIQAVGLHVAKVIYGFTPSPVIPYYKRVVFVGHSLGSVLAYDTLNAITNLDLTSGEPQHVVSRTKHLITFGSPLNKTAFIFRNQSNHVDDPLREQMAAASQPLILNQCFREGLRWHNLWSHADIISGPLNYYNDQSLPANDPTNVQTEKDPAAWVPLYAHVQYWTGKRLASLLYDAVE